MHKTLKTDRYAVRRYMAAALIALAVVLCLSSVASACPTCKDGIAGEDSNVKEGYFWSIIFMMSMPFLIFAALSTYFFLLVRRARRKQAACESIDSVGDIELFADAESDVYTSVVEELSAEPVEV